MAAVSCHESGRSDMAVTPEATADMAASEVRSVQETEDLSDNERPDKMMIRTGILAWETENPVLARQKILHALQQAKGYVSEDNEERLYQGTRYTLVLRVPSDRFDALLTRITDGVEEFETREIGVRDVSAEYVDLSERLKTKKELENRYRDLLARADKIDDMLRIERAIAAERAEIESMEGRLRLMSHQVAYSTLRIHLTAPAEEVIVASTGFGTQLKDSFMTGWDLTKSLIVGTVAIWPLVLLVAIAVFFMRKYSRRKTVPAAKDRTASGGS